MPISNKIRSLFSNYLSENTSESWMRFALACHLEWLDPEEVAARLHH